MSVTVWLLSSGQRVISSQTSYEHVSGVTRQ
jgi:hypothetical protein